MWLWEGNWYIFKIPKIVIENNISQHPIKHQLSIMLRKNKNAFGENEWYSIANGTLENEPFLITQLWTFLPVFFRVALPDFVLVNCIYIILILFVQIFKTSNGPKSFHRTYNEQFLSPLSPILQQTQ